MWQKINDYFVKDQSRSRCRRNGIFNLKFFGGHRVEAYLCAPENSGMSRVRLRARTPPFHGGDTGSNPVRGTKACISYAGFSVLISALTANLTKYLCGNNKNFLKIWGLI